MRFPKEKEEIYLDNTFIINASINFFLPKNLFYPNGLEIKTKTYSSNNDF